MSLGLGETIQIKTAARVGMPGMPVTQDLEAESSSATYSGPWQALPPLNFPGPASKPRGFLIQHPSTL